MPHRQYPQILFNYIHNNPVKVGLVKCAQNWEFSSAADYYGERGGNLVSKKLAGEYLDI